MKRCIGWDPAQRSPVWRVRYSGFPTQKLSGKGQAWSFWVFTEASLHSHDWLMDPTSSPRGWDWKFCLITVLISFGFPGSQPPPLGGSQKSPSLELCLQPKVKIPNVTFFACLYQDISRVLEVVSQKLDEDHSLLLGMYVAALCVCYMCYWVREGRRGLRG